MFKKFVYSLCSISMVLFFVGCLHNVAPIADAGHNQNAVTGQYVQLNGTNSYDPDGNISAFNWRIVNRPANSKAQLEFSDSDTPHFIPELPGVYVIELIVYDGDAFSEKDTVIVTVREDQDTTRPPIQSPGPEQLDYKSIINEEILLTSVLAINPEMDTSWVIEVTPESGSYKLEHVAYNQALFIADTVGQYILIMTIYSPGNNLGPFRVTIDILENGLNVGEDRLAKVGNNVMLSFDFVGSNNSVHDDFVFNDSPETVYRSNWSFIRMPEDSQTEIIQNGNIQPYFMPDVEGEYELLLTVQIKMENGLFDTRTDAIVITAKNDLGRDNFDHTGIIDNCVSCHDGITASTKSAAHIVTTDNCYSCHDLAAWLPVVLVDHLAVTGNCETCHNGVIALGKTVSHLHTSDSCDACHSTQIFAPSTTVNHSEVIGDCMSCHNGIFAPSKTASHLNTSDRCDACHSVYMFIPVNQVDHSQVFGECAECHDGVGAVGKSTIHVKTISACDLCHTTSTWKVNAESEPMPDTGVPSDLGMEILLSKDIYEIGERIEIKSVFTNYGMQPIQYYRLPSSATGVIVEVLLDNGDRIILPSVNDPVFDLPVENISELAAGESIVESVVWDQTDAFGNKMTAGVYNIKAYSIIFTTDGISRAEFSQFSQVELVDDSVKYISDDKAIIAALQEPEVNEWYAGKAFQILCSTQSTGTIQVNDFVIVPIATLSAGFAPVPESELNCQTDWIADKSQWLIKFKGENPSDKFKTKVIVDGLTGEIVESKRD